jgi:NTE family protein
VFRLNTVSLIGAGLIAMLTASVSHTQEANESESRPKVGLVLSGGAARGGAHIGVLRALEELHVPIDYVAGTSIGAAIGGFYAAGMTVDDLEEFVRGIDWEEAFLNATPRELRSFRRKRDDDLFLVEQRPGFNHGEVSLPTGVVQGHMIDMILTRVTLPVSQISDFDDLMIPFRAVAADIVNGEVVVLDSGDFSTAIRASMSIPAVLVPIEIDGRLLVDGGISMNLPVEVAKDMGADRIIAVDITSPMLERDELRSVVSVTAQLTNMLTRRRVAPQLELLEEEDVLLTPEFEEAYSSVNFARMADTIEIGYQLVMEDREQFEHLSLDEEEYARYRAELRDPREPELPVIDFVRVESGGLVADSIIEDRLKDIELGAALNVEQVEQAINTVYGLEHYQTVRYSVVEENGQRGIVVDPDPRSWGPNYVQLGLQYSSSADEDALFGFAASYLRTGINDRGGEFRSTLVMGDEPGLYTDLYQPLGSTGRYFVAPSLNYESKLLNLFEGDEISTELLLRELTLEIAAGRELGHWGEIRVGARRADGQWNRRVGAVPNLSDDEYRRGEFFSRFSIDTFDDIAFPRSGVLATTEWRGSRSSALGADSDFDQLLISAAHAKTWGRYTLLTTARYDSTISGVAPFDRLYQFGGFLDLSGLNRNQLSGQHVARVGASVYRSMNELALFPAFVGFSLEYGTAADSRNAISSANSLLGGSLWAGVDTPIGPIYLSYGLAEGGEEAFYVFLGRIF